MAGTSEWRGLALKAVFLVVVAMGGSAMSGAQGAACPKGADATVNPACWPKLTAPIPRDPALEARIDRLLENMSVEDKVGQIIQADIDSITPADIREYRLGSILNGGNSAPGKDNRAPAPDWLALADAFYTANDAAWAGRETIPLLWGTDAVHGHNNIVGATLFPHNIGLGAANDPDLIRRIGAVTAREVRVTGQDWTFAPTLAVAQDIRWGRSYESYAQDPQIVAAYGAAMVEGLQGRPEADGFLTRDKLIATAKHFLGDGGTHKGKDQGDARASETVLRDVHAAGYVSALPAGAQTVMASFSSWRGVKLHGHKGLLTDVLKGRFGFDGFVVGDWNGHGQIPGCSNTNCPDAIIAGVDMFMAPDSWRELYTNTLAQARSGAIPATRLDDAVRRILRVKLRAGLFDAPRPSARPLAGQFDLLGAEDHRVVAREAVRKSLVLLKDDNVLPLRPSQTILVAGDGADNMSKQTGGWTLSWQGDGNTREHFPNAETIYEGIAAAVQGAGGRVTRDAGARADAAIIVFGEDPYAEFEGDLDRLAYQPSAKTDLRLIRDLKGKGLPVIAVFLSGRPRAMDAEIDAADAFVAAWLPGSEGGGVADLLFADETGARRHDFTGRLSFDWPGDDGKTRFSVGHGVKLQAQSRETGAISRNSFQKTLTDPMVLMGQPETGWRLVLTSTGSKLVPMTDGVGGTDDGALMAQAFDRFSDADAVALAWAGEGDALASLRGKPVDLTAHASRGDAVQLDYRVDAPPTGPVALVLGCQGDCQATYDVTAVFQKAKQGQWQSLRVPLRCFKGAGSGLSSVDVPFGLMTRAAFGISLSRVTVVPSPDAACP